ncbi:unnamed protein product, partial [Amoebophrya sp. A120]
WVPVVDKALREAREQADREINDLRKIVRWDLSNFTAMRDSVKRSHRQLAKIAKRFDVALQEQTDQVLSRQLQTHIEKTDLGPEDVIVDDGLEDVDEHDYGSTAGMTTDTEELSALTSFSTNFSSSILQPYLLVVEVDGKNTGTKSPSGNKLRFSDTDAFWRHPDAIFSIRERMTSLVKTKVLPELWAFRSADEGNYDINGLFLGQDFAQGVTNVLESLKDQSVNIQLKKRQLQGIKDELQSYGIKYRSCSSAQMLNAGIELFTTPFPEIATHMQPSCLLGGGGGFASFTDVEHLQLTLMTTERTTSSGMTNLSFESNLTRQRNQLWPVIEHNLYTAMHSFLRIRSRKEPPQDLTNVEYLKYVGIATEAVRLVSLREMQAFGSLMAILRSSSFEDGSDVDVVQEEQISGSSCSKKSTAEQQTGKNQPLLVLCDLTSLTHLFRQIDIAAESVRQYEFFV